MILSKKVDLTIKYVHVILPVRYGEEQIPYDFPLRVGDIWEAVIDVDSGKIVGWPEHSEEGNLFLKVVDEGIYMLKDSEMALLAKRQSYVPHDLIPGEYGDYVELKISNDGTIKNWRPCPCGIDFEDFTEA